MQNKRVWDEKMRLIKEEWENGLQSTAAPFHNQIQQLADPHSLKFDQVKVESSFQKAVTHLRI